MTRVLPLDRGQLTCHLCNTLFTRKHKTAEWETRWLTKCAESLAQLMDIEKFGPSFFFLNSEVYCPNCITLIADIDFSVRASASLNNRISTLKTKIATFLHKRMNSTQQEAVEVDTFPEESQNKLYFDKNFKLKVDESLETWNGHSEVLLLQPIRTLRTRTRIVYQDDNITESDCDDRDIGNDGDDDDWKPHDPQCIPHSIASPEIPTPPPKRKRKIKGTPIRRTKFRTSPTCFEHNSELTQSHSGISEKIIFSGEQFSNKMEAEVDMMNKGIGSKTAKRRKFRDLDGMSKEPFLQNKKNDAKCPRKFPCTQPVCPYRAQSETILVFHLLEHHPEIDAQPYLCDGCGKGFRKRKTYNMHPCVKAGHHCEECGNVFLSKFRLTRHKKMWHKDVVTFSCSVCARLYYRPEDVATHEKLHTPATGSNCVIHGCENPCFESLEALRVHVAGPSHDVAQSVKVCDLCGYMSKGVYSAKMMKVHMRTHTGEEPFKCRFCAKRFKTRQTRTSHEQINHSDLVEKKIYACKQCDATFTVAQYLFKHNAWHKYGKNACLPVTRKH